MFNLIVLIKPIFPQIRHQHQCKRGVIQTQIRIINILCLTPAIMNIYIYYSETLRGDWSNENICLFNITNFTAIQQQNPQSNEKKSI